NELHAQFHLDEPWDSDHNRPLLSKMPDVYRSPMVKAQEGMTNYLAVSGERAVLGERSPVSIKQIIDGTSNTLMIVEADEPIEWTKPADFTPSLENPTTGLGKLHPKGYFIAGFADGEVHFVPTDIDTESFAAMFTMNGGESSKWRPYDNLSKKAKAK